MTRLRDLGYTVGFLPVGKLNAITDVPGVRVGHTTVIRGEGPLRPGEGPVRTGVTVVMPHGGNLYREKVTAGVQSINGYGKAMGFEQIRERGTIETPIALTSTLNVGIVADALVSYTIDQNPDIGIRTGTVNPIVGECSDWFVNDLQGRHVRPEHVWHAIDTASDGIVVEGCVGGGTGMQTFQFKSGIGTSSRMVLDGQFAVGALVQSNYGLRREMMFLGAPIGRDLQDSGLPKKGDDGSIMIVIATDAPLTARQLQRMAMRAALALGRTGTVSRDTSGDFAIAFSTTSRWKHEPGSPTETVERFTEGHDFVDELFLATVESIEEAILNSLVAATTMTGWNGNTLYALPHDTLISLLEKYGHRR